MEKEILVLSPELFNQYLLELIEIYDIRNVYNTPAFIWN
jgi:hypothetical protein